MTAMIEALSFLGLRGPVICDEQSCILCMLLVFFWAQSKLVHTCSWRLHVNSLSSVPNVGCGSPCSTCMVIVELWVMNVLIMPLHLAHLDSSLTTTLPHAGFIITFTLVCFVGCDNISEVLERLQHIRTDATSFHQDRCKRWFSSSGPPCPLCISRDVWSCVSFGLSLFPRYSCFPNK